MHLDNQFFWDYHKKQKNKFVDLIIRREEKEVPKGMDLEGIEAAGEDKLKSDREDDKWRRWWLLAAAISEDLTHAARRMDLTLITASFSISLAAVVMQKSLVGSLQINWRCLLLYSTIDNCR